MKNQKASFPPELNAEEIFTPRLLEEFTLLHRELNPKRLELLKERKLRQKKIDSGELPSFECSHPAKTTQWMVAPIPEDLLDRRVEITGPVSSAKMVINMLSPNQKGELAQMAMLDFEDSMAPTWENVVTGYKNVIGVATKNLSYVQTSASGAQKIYRLDPRKMAHPMVRVRGLHLNESHLLVDNSPVSAGLLDLFTVAFHTAKIFLNDGKTPKFYIPKTEHYLEARWWNEAIRAVEKRLSLKEGALRVTVLIETLPAAFQMEEILYELKERICGLNVGRWDKIFSDIKTLKFHKDRILPDRSTIDMKRPWMDNYARLLIKTCHKHGAFAMGGMSAFTPGADESTRSLQLEKVRLDKAREAEAGHDGCWVSHPYFIGMAQTQFKKKNQLEVKLENFSDTPDLLPKGEGPRTIKGLRQNLRVGIAYQLGWSEGQGCVAFENLMEDLATLEISRAQVWQWLYHGVILDEGEKVTPPLISRLLDEECEAMLPLFSSKEEALRSAKENIKTVFLKTDLIDFFTEI